MPDPLQPSRRGFLAWCAALGLWPRLQGADPVPAKAAYTPSFLHPNDRWVFLPGGTRKDGEERLDLWDVQSGERVRSVKARPGQLLGGAEASEFLRSGNQVWISEGTLYGSHVGLVDIATGRVLDTPHADMQRTLRTCMQAHLRRGGRLELGHMEGKPELIPQLCPTEWRDVRQDDGPRILALSASGRHALVFRDGADRLSARLWVAALPTGKELAVLNREDVEDRAATFTPDASAVIFLAGDTLWHWRWAAGRKPERLAKYPKRALEVEGACGKEHLEQNAVGAALIPEPPRGWVALDTPTGVTQGSKRLGTTRLESLEGQAFHPDLPCHGAVDLALSQDGGTLVIRYGQGTVRTYDLATRRMTRLVTAFLPHSHLLAFGPSADHLLVARPAGLASLWQRQGPVLRIRSSTGCPDLLRRPPIRTLLDRTGASAKVQNRTAWSRERPSLPEARSVAWSPDGGTFAVGHEHGTVLLYPAAAYLQPQDWQALAAHENTGSAGNDWKRYEATHILWNRGAAVRAVAFHPTRPQVVSLHADGTACVWARADASRLRTWQAHPQRANTLALKGDHLITGGLDGVALWDEAGQALARFGTDGHEVCGLAVSPDGALLAAACLDGWVRVWDLPSGKLRWKTEAHGGWAAAVAFSPDGSRLASGGEDGTVAFWSPEAGQQLARGKAYGHALAWSPDGAWLACSGMDRVRLLGADLTYQDRTSNRLFLDWNDQYT